MPIFSGTKKTQKRKKKQTNRKSKTKIKTKKPNKWRQKRTRGDRNYNEWVRAKWFCCAFKLGFLQLICKASLIFKSNLELALSIILK